MMHSLEKLRLYYPLWDDYFPSTVDGFSDCKMNLMQSQHIHGSLVENRDGASNIATHRCFDLHIRDGCEFSVLWVPSADMVST